LPSLQKLSDEFGGQPTDGVLHIIVRVSTRGKSPTHLIQHPDNSSHEEEPAPPNLLELRPFEFQDADPIVILRLRKYKEFTQLSSNHLCYNDIFNVSVVPRPLEDFLHDLWQQCHIPSALISVLFFFVAQLNFLY